MGFSSVFFIVLCVLLVILILLQSDKSSGMGILGGSSQSAFGSSTADIVTKITAVMVALFLVGSLGISALESYKNRSIAKKILSGGDTPTVDMKAGEKKPAGEKKSQ
jgi:preprotein translocase subunit SecG